MIRSLTSGAMPVVLVATAIALGACTSDSNSVDDATGGGSASTESTATEKPSAAVDKPIYSPEAGEVMELSTDQRWATMRQGRYAVRLTPSTSYEVDVPDQWRVFQGRFLNSPQSGANSIFFAAPAPADATGLPRHPCRDHTVVPVGPTVGDLAAGLRGQPVLEVSKPSPVTLDGHRGLYVQVRIPKTVDSGSCVDDSVALFSNEKDDWGWTEGFIGQWWILNVDGARIVVMPQCDTACTEADLDTLITMAKSVAITNIE